jgi:hypothetical protein
MALSEDHKAKMKAGRVRAAEARKLAAKSTAAMPAGHERDEQRRINKDANEQRIEERDDALGLEGIDQAKLKHRDREIQDYLEKVDNQDVENAQPGFIYGRITCPEGYGNNAKANIREMKRRAEAAGYVPVQGNMPEDERYKGNDHANGGTLRGLFDTFLWRITQEKYDELMAKNAEQARRQGGIEDQVVRYAESRGIRTMHGAAGDFRSQDPLMAQVAGDAGRVETFRGQRPGQVQTKFSEGDIRRGSIKGPGGQIMKPGFERENLAGRQ